MCKQLIGSHGLVGDNHTSRGLVGFMNKVANNKTVSLAIFLELCPDGWVGGGVCVTLVFYPQP